MTALAHLLETFRTTAATEREEGTYFERLVKAYLLNESYYRDLYAGQVWLWKGWGDVGTDAGIDQLEVGLHDYRYYNHERIKPRLQGLSPIGCWLRWPA